jgi:prepilin-type N-terminal cleavage/methylation domain-containing protein
MRPLISSPVRRGPPGFTLLEISIVLFIMVLLVGLCIYSFGGLTAERELRKPVSELQRMTMEAVRRAALQEKPQVILFEPTGFAIRYRQDPDGIRQKDEDEFYIRRVKLPPAMKLTLRRWGAEKFVPAPGQRLVVAASGLCEPLTARFELGASWLEVTVDPLSGRVIDEGMHIPGDS